MAPPRRPVRAPSRKAAGIGGPGRRTSRFGASREASRSHRTGSIVVVLTALGALASGGCSEPERATLIAVAGCGLNNADMRDLRVQTRGDFALSSATQVFVDSGLALVGEDVGDVAAITVEGLTDDLSVLAVGRTARLRPNGEIPVYFAAADQLCEVESDGAVLFRTPGAMAVSEMGDVVIVGGRDASGVLVDEIVHLADEQGMPRVLGPRLPEPATGQSVHAVGPRSFFVIGGAGHGDAALSSVLRLDFGDGGEFEIGAPQPINVPLQGELGRAHHGAASWPDGSVLVTGGCTQVGTAGACAPSETAVLASSFFVAPAGDDIVFERAPALLSPRYGHAVHVARDGVAFAVGGRRPDGRPEHAIDMLAPGEASWVSYGPTLSSELPDTTMIEGSALLEGGLIALAIDDGTIRWVNAEATGVFPGWCDPADDGGPCFAGQREGPDGDAPARPPGPRALAVLPGERIVADHFVLPVFGLGQTGADALDLADPPPGSSAFPPKQRTGALSLSLADGTVVMAGGLEPLSQLPLLPLTLRFRPALDGPDESIPGVGVLAPGSLVGLQPDRLELEPEGDGIRLSSAGTVVDFPSVRARARGFRSRSFRFEATLSASDAFPHVVLEQGAVAGLSVRFGPGLVRGFFRNAAGSVIDFSCGTLPDDFWASTQSLQVTVRPDSFVVSQGDETLAQCPAPQLEGPVSIGIGVSGSGSVTATALRLTRI